MAFTLWVLGACPARRGTESQLCLQARLSSTGWPEKIARQSSAAPPLTPSQYPAGALCFSFIQNTACISSVVICFGSGFCFSGSQHRGLYTRCFLRSPLGGAGTTDGNNSQTGPLAARFRIGLPRTNPSGHQRDQQFPHLLLSATTTFRLHLGVTGAIHDF